jgi:hypothetical protein
MAFAGKLKRCAHGTALVLAVMFLVATVATSKRLVPTGSAKLITFDHEVRRDLTRAERQGLKTSASSATAEPLRNPLQEPVTITVPLQIGLNSSGVLLVPNELASKSIFLEFSPVLNL